MISNLKLQQFLPAQTTEKEWEALNTFQNRLLSAFETEAKPVPLALTREQWSGLFPIITDPRVRLVWDTATEAIIARAAIGLAPGNEPERLVPEFNITVLPNWRRQGIGTALLRQLSSDLQQPIYRFTTRTDSNDPSGDAFMQHIGAYLALALLENSLDLSAIDMAQIDTLQHEAQQRLPGFEIAVWTMDDITPEILPAVAKLMNAWDRDMPHEQLQRDSLELTPEMIAGLAAQMKATGNRSLFIYARDQATGEYIGFCMTGWNIQQPQVGELVAIEVFEAYRGRGLGRLLTLALIAYLKHNHPQMRRLDTLNAHSNTAALKLNKELGFKVQRTRNRWEISPEQVEAYLASRADQL